MTFVIDERVIRLVKEKIKVYLYTRVSTLMQIDGYSLDAQKTKMKAEIRSRSKTTPKQTGRGILTARQSTSVTRQFSQRNAGKCMSWG